jgi:hypothetical protein
VTAKLLSHLEEASSGSLVDMMAVLETCLEDVNKHRKKVLGDVKKMWGKASVGLMGSGIASPPLSSPLHPRLYPSWRWHWTVLQSAAVV